MILVRQLVFLAPAVWTRRDGLERQGIPKCQNGRGAWMARDRMV